MTILIALTGLSLMIVVHELGHLLAARAFGVRVEEFTLGSGPLLLQAKLGGTLFSLRLLVPVGGSVRFAGTGERGSGAFDSLTGWRGAVICMAGPAVNLLSSLLLLFALFVVDLPPLPAFEAAVWRAIEMTGLLGDLAVNLLTGGGLLGAVPGLLEDVAGSTGSLSSSGLQLLALIGLYLGLFNLLPIPPLDGGRLLLLLVEGLRGRPLAPRAVVGIITLGIAFMSILALFVAYEDLREILSWLL